MCERGRGKLGRVGGGVLEGGDTHTFIYMHTLFQLKTNIPECDGIVHAGVIERGQVRKCHVDGPRPILLLVYVCLYVCLLGCSLDTTNEGRISNQHSKQ